jgi:hypothetical protein
MRNNDAAMKEAADGFEACSKRFEELRALFHSIHRTVVESGTYEPTVHGHIEALAAIGGRIALEWENSTDSMRENFASDAKAGQA